MRSRWIPVLLAFAAVISACDSGSGTDPDPTLGGSYAYETPPDDSTTGTITIAETEGSIVGSGTVQFRDADGTVVAVFPIGDIQGSHDHPTVSMQWQIDGQGTYSEVGPWSVEGTASDDGSQITGTLTRDGDNTSEIVFERQ